MKAEDADRVYEIENDSFFEPWSKRRLLKEFEENSFLRHFVYEKDGEIVGFYIISLIADLVEIFTIAVDKDYRQEGIGDALLTQLVSYARENSASEIWLEASTKNIAAINLYQKHGFKIQSIRKNYYQKTGEDAYNMIRIMK
ncbi:ribosomal protein S18-alanine N-acetyltransferase [uncultured Anaerococcus sp.]|uniref:ribosomal protein S18-alanine N-acetyltransferase n=1 Tax=uncultured Anaerococcus sp. TaxID=293428 RepID=UPI00344063B4